MNMNPLIEDVVSTTGLPPSQVEGAVGLALKKLRDILSESDFQTVLASLPNAGTWIQQAPDLRKGFLSSIAGGKAGLLIELSQGLRKLGIPTDQHTPLAKAVGRAVETHHPELVPLFHQLNL